MRAERLLRVKRERLERLSLQLQERSPLRVLERGYAIATDADGKVCVTLGKWQSGKRSIFNFIAGVSLRKLRKRNKDRESLLFFVAGDFQDGEEGFLGDVDLADALHAVFAFFLFFKEFAFAGNVSAIAFGEHIFANGGDGFAGDDPAADGGLDRHFKHLAGNQLSEAANQFAAALKRQIRGG